MKPVIGAVLENDLVRYVIGAEGTSQRFIDKRTGKDYCDRKAGMRFAQVRKSGQWYGASAVSSTSSQINVEFGDSGVRAIFQAKAEKRYLTIAVISVEGDSVEQLAFAEVALKLKAYPEEPFACTAMALNLQTNVPEIPGLNNRLRAYCYPRTGMVAAKVAIVGCPTGEIRKIMQEVVTAAPDLPHSPLGGPCALDAEIARGSYLFNFGGLSESTVDNWIRLAQSLGINQIDFHGGSSFRFGDCRPNPDTYPKGRASLKVVIDKLHAAGIKAGLHTYAFFIDKRCPWVTPMPDPRLGTDARFTLTEDLAPDNTTILVVEPTKDMTTITGFFERNSVTLRVDDELITYTGISKDPPYAFTGGTRGALGTKAAAHAKGAQVHHLKECFGLFCPEGDSTLLAEVAAVTADTFNECGFDMMYLDALDGEDILGGGEYGWHYGSKFVFELVRRLKRPALMEMSTFHHHLWYVRSRIGAMDYPNRSQKRFIDIHCQGNPHVVHATGNLNAARMFLPVELGWWAVHTADDLVQGERTFPDDIEYLMCKCMATDTGFALIGLDPASITGVPAFSALAPIFKHYEDLRHAHYFPDSVTRKLAKPGDEFTLEQTKDNKWRLRPVQYAKYKVEGTAGTNVWTAHNKFNRQPVQLRLEPLMSAAPYDSPEGVTIVDFTKPEEFTDRTAESNIVANLANSTDQVKVGGVSGFLTATNSRVKREGAWAKLSREFLPALNIAGHEAFGVWVYGDGQGEVINLQIKSPKHLAWGIGDHYVRVDFTGWRYFELIEPEGERTHDYFWPYEGDIYGIYREKVNYGQVGTLSLWYNNLPLSQQVKCYLSPIKALPLVKGKLINPKVTIAGKTITFPVELEPGSYLEFRSASDCKVFGPKGELLSEVKPLGEAPTIDPGDNEVRFECDSPAGVSIRAWVTVITRSARPLTAQPR